MLIFKIPKLFYFSTQLGVFLHEILDQCDFIQKCGPRTLLKK